MSTQTRYLISTFSFITLLLCLLIVRSSSFLDIVEIKEEDEMIASSSLALDTPDVILSFAQNPLKQDHRNKLDKQIPTIYSLIESDTSLVKTLYFHLSLLESNNSLNAFALNFNREHYIIPGFDPYLANLIEPDWRRVKAFLSEEFSSLYIHMIVEENMYAGLGPIDLPYIAVIQNEEPQIWSHYNRIRNKN